MAERVNNGKAKGGVLEAQQLSPSSRSSRLCVGSCCPLALLSAARVGAKHLGPDVKRGCREAGKVLQ